MTVIYVQGAERSPPLSLQTSNRESAELREANAICLLAVS